MKLVVTGATGFIGTTLCRTLLDKGHTLVLLTRSSAPEPSTANKQWLQWTPGIAAEWQKTVDGADGIINLAGEPIAARRWTSSQKTHIRSSRILSTRSLVEAAEKARHKPAFLLNASAVGYYGPHGDDPLTEESRPGGDFLATVVREWEEEAKKAEPLGLRVVRLRTGIVLGPKGGALAKMVPPFKFYLGGPLGSGMQWMSWIHLEDEVGLILHLINDQGVSGAVNATAPNPVRMREFCQTLGEVLRRPCWAPVPGFALQILLGEMSDMLLTGQRVLPAAAEKSGFQFRYPTLRAALQACMPL